MKTIKLTLLFFLLVFVVAFASGCDCGDDDDDDDSGPADDDDGDDDDDDNDDDTSPVDDDDDDDDDDNDDDDTVDCIDEDDDTYGENCDNGPDCNDYDAGVYQWLTGYSDADDDGYPGTAVEVCSGDSLPAMYYTYSDDCVDDDATIHPGAEESPDDGIDQDCSGEDFTADDSNGIFVDGTGGDDITGTGTQGFPFATVVKGIQIAETARILPNVYIAQGTYTENVITTGTNLYGGYDPSDWSRDVENNTTTIVADCQDMGVKVTTDVTVTLDGLTIVGGSGITDSIGIFVDNNSIVTMKNCDIRAGSTIDNGYGVFGTNQNQLKIINCAVNGGADPVTSTMGVMSTNGNLVIRDSDISTGNTPSNYGVMTSNSMLDIQNSTVTLADGSSCYGILVTAGQSYIKGVEVDAAAAMTTGSVYGILLSSNIGHIEDTSVVTPDLASGANYGVLLSSGSLDMIRTTVKAGDALIGISNGVNCSGGGISIVNIIDSLVQSGDAGTASIAVSILGSVAGVYNSTLIAGEADDVEGIFFIPSSPIVQPSVFANNIIFLKEAVSVQSVIYLPASVETDHVELYNNILYYAPVTRSVPEPHCLIREASLCWDTIEDVNNCEWHQCNGAGGNLDDVPGFVDGDNDDFHLASDSPAIDAGISPLIWDLGNLDEAIWWDLDGNIRPYGDGWDIGAYEFAE